MVLIIDGVSPLGEVVVRDGGDAGVVGCNRVALDATGFNEIKSNIGNQNVYDVILDDNGAWVNIGTSRERVTTAQGTLYLRLPT